MNRQERNVVIATAWGVWALLDSRGDDESRASAEDLLAALTEIEAQAEPQDATAP